MQNITLNGLWQLRNEGGTLQQDVQVPGSVYNDLLISGQLEDPFYRDHEKHAKDVMRQRYTYSRSFEVSEDVLMNDRIELVCEGLDTLSSIYINDHLIAETDNMHRIYTWDVKSHLTSGDNYITITFADSLAYIAAKQEKTKLWGVDTTVDGFPHLRKAHYSYGWDWGPQLPDAGIWRNIYLNAYETGRIEDVYITQQHQENHVNLNLRVQNDLWSSTPLTIVATITSPEGQVFQIEEAAIHGTQQLELTIDEPRLWWPNGYGEQPLYQVQLDLKNENVSINEKKYTIGLRTITVRRDPDEWGEAFEFVVNGTSIFAMGANYIPEDSFLPRTSTARTELLIRDCIEANFNCIRIWGGGIYPDSDFYALCDRYGLIVWQDFMFACAEYELTDEFAANIKQEAIDTIRRLRHHASLGIWCGNNELEAAWVDWGFPKTEERRQDYLQQFEVLLAEVAAQYDPATFYWSSSPSSGGGFDNPSDPNRGDVHYWDVWHGLKPFTEYRSFHFRFCSEFGFQSFPSLKTIETFTEPEDRNIFSYVMERHQKNDGANGKILYYLSQNFKYPKDFSSLIYTSQLLQAEAMKYGVEHWRRNRGRCMGSIYWQLNDCWPVASWSSIDYYGRWKALHYFAKRFYAPILLSACEEGTEVSLHVSNETMSAIQGTVTWRLHSTKTGLLKEGSLEVEVSALSSSSVIALDFSQDLSESDMRSSFLEYRLDRAGTPVSDGILLFSAPKHFEFGASEITASWKETDENFEVTLQSSGLGKYVELEFDDLDGRWSDNYFDLAPAQPKTVTLRKDSLTRVLSMEQLQTVLRIRSASDIADV